MDSSSKGSVGLQRVMTGLWDSEPWTWSGRRGLRGPVLDFTGASERTGASSVKTGINSSSRAEEGTVGSR